MITFLLAQTSHIILVFISVLLLSGLIFMSACSVRPKNLNRRHTFTRVNHTFFFFGGGGGCVLPPILQGNHTASPNIQQNMFEICHPSMNPLNNLVHCYFLFTLSLCLLRKALGMGKTISFQDSVPSVPFPITNRLFDLFVQFVQFQLSQMVCYVIWPTSPANGAFFTPCPTVRVLSAVETPALIELRQTAPVTVLGKQHISVALAYDDARLSFAYPWQGYLL